MTRGLYDPDGEDAEEASLRLEPEDVLADVSDDDVLSRGYVPEDRPWAVDDWGTTDREEEQGEGLDGRLAREVPDEAEDDEDEDDNEGDGLGDVVDTDGELRDAEVGDRRSGRLADTDAGSESGPDDEPDREAFDEGIDGGAASAEEGAVHVVPDEDDDR
jgi:Family of unknown function (DUF5709)